LSGGQQQRVSLARALVVEPETLLLDEPLSNLDANLREEMRFEIRRLHDRYRYTTVYVTHDQSEAMTTADLIAVMNLGRIEQLGTPQEIYDLPRSAFVARFIGGANILSGKAIDVSRIALAGGTLATTGRPLTAGEPTSVSVRQHEIEILPAKPADTGNVIAAVVSRQVFLGSARDYTVALPDKTELRVTAPPTQDIAPGKEVWLRLPAERCRALMGGSET
jgi:iron(III) transport system ATP-binding protein